jgi:hypothetical protein
MTMKKGGRDRTLRMARTKTRERRTTMGRWRRILELGRLRVG